MSTELIKYAFIAGEISRTLFGRTDLTKYDLGVALAKNWFVDYRGGLSTRACTEFLDYIKADDKDVLIVDFQFSPDLSNTYVVLFGDNYIRFVQDGAYVVEDGRTVSAISATGGTVTVTSNAHGYNDDDWVKFTEVDGIADLNGFSWVVSDATTNTFKLKDPRTGAYINRDGQTMSGTPKVYRIYEIASPYAAEDLAGVSSSQVRDLLRLTSPDFPIYNLIRHDHTDWEIALEDLGGETFTEGQWNTALSASISGTLSVIYQVSAVLANGDESSPCLPVRMSTAGSFVGGTVITISWDAIPGAIEYIVYRSTYATGSTKIPAGIQMGFLGRTKSTFFVDANITPDFTKAPYDYYNPFSPGAIESITITNGGSGYDFIAPITITGGGGSGFSGYAVVDEAGKVTNAVILNAGKGYSSPVVTIGGAGTGATATATVGASSGVYPSISAIFQRRQVYAASFEKPLTVWGSKIDYYNNFDTSAYVIDSDSYEFDIDAAQIAPILHIFSLRGGLVMLSQTGIWLLTGGGNGGSVTPTEALADPQNFNGVSAVRPLQIGSDLLYVEGKGYAVRLLSYNDFSKVYSGEDKSILSNHLFSKDREITSWVFAENPYKLVYGVRSDGALVMFTTVKEQDVYAWTWGTTKGLFYSVLAIPENKVDTVYTVVERFIEGEKHKYLERFKPRSWNSIEEAYCVDCGFQIVPSPVVGATLDISPEFVENNLYYVTLTSSTSQFTGQEGSWVRGAGGIFVIKEVTSGTVAKAVVVKSATALLPEDPTKTVLRQTVWSLATPTTEFSGLFHLEGETVSILGDGNVFPQQVVTDGKITLPDGVSTVAIGLPMTAVMQTLPPTVTDTPIEARKKRIVGIAVRLEESRGLEIGRTLEELYPLRERTNEAYGNPIVPINGFKHQILSTEWDEDAQTYFVQSDPLPASILALVPDLEVGDDTN